MAIRQRLPGRSTWIQAGCIVHDERGPCLRPNGTPETRQCLFSTADAEIIDTWHSTGLRGSGSHDFAVKDYFVPEERTFSFQNLDFLPHRRPLHLSLSISFFRSEDPPWAWRARRLTR